MKNISDCVTGPEWSEVRRDVLRFLETWSFSISDTGLIYVRPLAKQLTARELNLFLKRLNLICDDRFPSLVVFDLAGAMISRSHWFRMKRNLNRFAAGIGAMILSGSNGEAGYYSLIWRSHALRREVNRISPAGIASADEASGREFCDSSSLRERCDLLIESCRANS
jgi:hypothetical protein